MVKHYQFSVLTDDEYSYHYIGEQVKAYVKESGITSGIVTTVVAHQRQRLRPSAEPADGKQLHLPHPKRQHDYGGGAGNRPHGI